MAQTMQGQQKTAVTPNGDRPSGVRVADRTETRKGIRTTEMYLAVITALAVIVAAYSSGTGNGSFPIRWGWLLAVVVISAYVVSRGIAKAGTSEPTYRRMDDDIR